MRPRFTTFTFAINFVILDIRKFVMNDLPLVTGRERENNRTSLNSVQKRSYV